MQALGRGAVPYQRARELVNATVPQHVAAWAKIIGLQGTDAQFQEDVTEALHASMRAHIATPHRWRWSDARKAYLRLAQDYAAIAQLLQPGGDVNPPLTNDPRFSALPSLWPDPPYLRTVALDQFRTALASFGDAAFFEGLAKAARQYAKRCAVDRGGHPPPYAFDALSSGLKHAFERATKRKATITHREDLGQWGGDFFSFVETVWSVACEIARTVPLPPPLTPSTPEARGKHLQRALKALERSG